MAATLASLTGEDAANFRIFMMELFQSGRRLWHIGPDEKDPEYDFEDFAPLEEEGEEAQARSLEEAPEPPDLGERVWAKETKSISAPARKLQGVFTFAVHYSATVDYDVLQAAIEATDPAVVGPTATANIQ